MGLKEGKIVKSFQFPTFMKAIEFVNDVAKIAEKINHQPVITINCRTVKLSLKSFDVNAITKRDINFAKEIEKTISIVKGASNPSSTEHYNPSPLPFLWEQLSHG